MRPYWVEKRLQPNEEGEKLLLNVKDITVHYNKVDAIRNISI